MNNYIPTLDDQLRQMGLPGVTEGKADDAPILVEDVGPKVKTLEEQMNEWGLGGGGVNESAHLEDFNLAESAQVFLSSATFRESYEGQRSTVHSVTGIAGHEGDNRADAQFEVRAGSAPDDPVVQNAAPVDEGKVKAMDDEDDDEDDDDDSEDKTEALMVSLAAAFSEGEFVQVIDFMAENDREFVEATARWVLDALAESIEDVVDGEDFLLRLENSEDPAAVAEARRLKALIGGVAKKLKKTSQKVKRKAKQYYRKNRSKILKKKKKTTGSKAPSSKKRKAKRRRKKARRMGTRKSMGDDFAMAMRGGMHNAMAAEMMSGEGGGYMDDLEMGMEDVDLSSPEAQAVLEGLDLKSLTDKEKAMLGKILKNMRSKKKGMDGKRPKTESVDLVPAAREPSQYTGPNRARRLAEGLLAGSSQAAKADKLVEEIDAVVSDVSRRQVEQAAATWQKLSDLSDKMATEFVEHGQDTGEESYARLGHVLGTVSESAAHYAQELRQGNISVDDPELARQFQEHLDSTTKAARLHATVFGEGKKGKGKGEKSDDGKKALKGMDADEKSDDEKSDDGKGGDKGKGKQSAAESVSDLVSHLESESDADAAA